MQLSEIWCLLICLGLFVGTFGDTTVDDIKTLDEEKCSKARKGCCEDFHTIIDDATVECRKMFKDKMVLLIEQNSNELFYYSSCFVYCVYKKNNYLVEGDEDINMQGVKEHVEKMYAGRSKEQQYFMKVFEFCRKEGLEMYTLYNRLKKDCKPYYLYVDVCQNNYHKKNTCPYFMWGARNGTLAAQECKAAKEQCYNIDGLTPPEQLTFD